MKLKAIATATFVWIGTTVHAQAEDACVITDFITTEKGDVALLRDLNVGRKVTLVVKEKVVSVTMSSVERANKIAFENKYDYEIARTGKYDMVAILEQAGLINTLVMPSKKKSKYKAVISLQGTVHVGVSSMTLNCSN